MRRRRRQGACEAGPAQSAPALGSVHCCSPGLEPGDHQGEPDLLDVGTEYADLEEASSVDGRTMLRYEEHITELLVTIMELNGRIEELQHNGGRDEDELLDQCSQYTSSLPRCAWPARRPEITPHSDKGCESVCPPGEEDGSELFAELQQVVTSLENVVSSRRNRTLSLQSVDGGADTGLPGLNTDDVEEWNAEEWSEAFEALNEMEGGLGVCSELTAEERSWYQTEIAGFREKNLALKMALGGKEAELDRSKVTLGTFQEERDRLQRKVKDLQDTVQRTESPPLWAASRSSSFSGAVSPSTEEEDWVSQHSSQDAISTVQSLVHCLQNCSRVRNLCQLLPQQPGPLAPESKVKELEAQLGHQRGCIDKLKCLNDLLEVTLEECKSDSERLSMLLGKHEHNSTALHLAVQASERCIAVHDVLQMLGDVKQEFLLGQVTEEKTKSTEETWKRQSSLKEFYGKKKMVLSEANMLLHKEDLAPAEEENDSGGPSQQISSNWNRFEMNCEEEEVLKDYICKLRQDQASIKATLVELALKGSTHPPDTARISEVIKAKVDDAIEASLDILPGYAETPSLDRGQLLQNLSSLRQDMADLKSELHLREKEKRGLELQAMVHGHQETTYRLLAENLEWELEDGSGRHAPLVRSASSTGDSSSCTEGVCEGATEANGAAGDPQGPGLTQELLQSMARCKELRSQIEELSLQLEKSARDDHIMKIQSIALTTDFFKAHSNLVAAYKNSRRKQADQLRQLENQVALMSKRHQGQVRSLRQQVEVLEERRAARVPGETSL